jgi:hypothetical protein
LVYLRKKTEKEKLQIQYKQLLKEAYELSSTNRKLSDQKNYEADQILNKINTIDN